MSVKKKQPSLAGAVHKASKVLGLSSGKKKGDPNETLEAIELKNDAFGQDINAYYSQLLNKYSYNTAKASVQILTQAIAANYQNSAWHIIYRTEEVLGNDIKKINTALELCLSSESMEMKTFIHLLTPGENKSGEAYALSQLGKLNNTHLELALERDKTSNIDESFFKALLDTYKNGSDCDFEAWDNGLGHLKSALASQMPVEKKRLIIEAIFKSTASETNKDTLGFYLANLQEKSQKDQLLQCVDPTKSYGSKSAPALYHAVVNNMPETTEKLLPVSNRSTKWFTYFFSSKVTLAVWIMLFCLSYTIVSLIPFALMLVKPLITISLCAASATVGTVSLYGIVYAIKESLFSLDENSFCKLHKNTWGNKSYNNNQEVTVYKSSSSLETPSVIATQHNDSKQPAPNLDGPKQSANQAYHF